MISPCADQSNAAETPKIAPAKIRNQRVPCVWKLHARDEGFGLVKGDDVCTTTERRRKGITKCAQE